MKKEWTHTTQEEIQKKERKREKGGGDTKKGLFLCVSLLLFLAVLLSITFFDPHLYFLDSEELSCEKFFLFVEVIFFLFVGCHFFEVTFFFFTYYEQNNKITMSDKNSKLFEFEKIFSTVPSRVFSFLLCFSSSSKDTTKVCSY